MISTARAQGLDAALQRIETIEEEHIEAYHAQARSLDDAASVRIIEDLVRDEASHAETLRDLTGFDVDSATPSPSIRASRTRARRDAQMRLAAILQQEKWHVTTGKWIGDAIYGVNDGLTAFFGLVSGVAGYFATGSFVVVAGMAGMLASALSMGASGYLASKAEREVIEAEVA